MDFRTTRTTILNDGSPDQKRQEIRDYFHKSYSLDEHLYDSLASDEAFYLRPEPLRHRMVNRDPEDQSIPNRKWGVAPINRQPRGGLFKGDSFGRNEMFRGIRVHKVWFGEKVRKAQHPSIYKDRDQKKITNADLKPAFVTHCDRLNRTS